MSYTLRYTGNDIDTILGRAAPGGQLDADIAAKAPLASPALTGDPTAPTQEEGDGSTKLATTEYADRAAASASVALLPTESVTPSSIASFPDGADDIPVKSATFSILPVQSGSGDPAPDNVRPISGWSGAEIYRTGINVWDGVAHNGAYWSDAGVLTLQASNSCTSMVPVKAGASYYFRPTSQSKTVKFFASDKTTLIYKENVGGRVGKAITAPSGSAYVIANVAASSLQSDFSINYPSTDTTYHAYDGQTITLTFGDTVYAGTITALGGGKWQIQPTHAFKTITSSDLNSAVAGGNAGKAAQVSLTYSNYGVSIGNNYCTHFVFTSGKSWSGGLIPYQCQFNNSGTTFGFSLTADDTTYDDFATWLDSQNAAGTPLQICYELLHKPDPIIVSASDLVTLLGSNMVWADCGDVTELTYRADLALYIQRVVNGDISTLSTLSLSPSPTLTLGRLGETLAPAAELVALTEDAESAVTDEDAATESAEPEADALADTAEPEAADAAAEAETGEEA